MSLLCWRMKNSKNPFILAPMGDSGCCVFIMDNHRPCSTPVLVYVCELAGEKPSLTFWKRDDGFIHALLTT